MESQTALLHLPVPGGHVFYFQQNRTEGLPAADGLHGCLLRHFGDELLPGDAGGGDGVHQPTVAEHCHPVGQKKNLVQPVGHI